jgi:hypothetical protein
LLLVVESFPAGLQVSNGTMSGPVALDKPGLIGKNYNFSNFTKFINPILDVEPTELRKRAVQDYVPEKENSEKLREP